VSLFSPVVMRKADPRHPEYHLLEELSRPQASLNAARISVFVYHDGPAIREVIVAGHAEGITCLSVTSILIGAAKQCGENVQWMLTCGAAYFRVTAPAPANFVLGYDATQRAQNVLREMIQALQEVSEETGLLQIVHEEWESLSAFRQAFRNAMSVQPAEIVLPASAPQPARVLDYVPIVPGRDPAAAPLTFRLEGWEFDCPGFQAVADVHLRKVHRELLRDAMRRRRTYRGWLKEWVEDWVKRLNWLPRHQAEGAVLAVPGDETAPPQYVPAAEFLARHAASFLDRGQRWHKELSYAMSYMTYDQMTAKDLDEAIHPQMITEIDFQRLEKQTRRATDKDGSFTWRQRITQDDPRMISHCLQYIRRMDAIIAPYEELRSGKDVASSRDPQRAREVRIIETISRQIVLETMVRGWPSVYLDDKADQEAFEAWAAVYRPRVWKILARQAKAQGVALDILLEDNVVYDVRFDSDLGCVIQPLMLVDDATHAQLHGTRCGASIAVPLWPRRATHDMPLEVIRLGTTNRKRAAALVAEACKLASASAPDSTAIAAKLRNALACHPAEAGKLILDEWWQRLGRDTSAEFAAACNFIEAAEWLRKGRCAEAQISIEHYLRAEARPVPDAYVIAALARLLEYDQTARDEVTNAINDFRALVKRHDELVSRLRGEMDLRRQPSPFDVDTLVSMKTKIESLEKQIETKNGQIKLADDERVKLIREALHSPQNVREAHPELARAAEKARDVLEEVEKNGGFYAGGPGLQRYGDTRRTIEVRGLLDIIYALARIAHGIEKDANEARQKAIAKMGALSAALWLPGEIESDLRHLAEECGKGKWDRLQSLQMVSIIREAIATCQSRMQDLLGSTVITGVPLKEMIATRIHVTQTLEFKYRTALLMLLEAKIAFGSATGRPWAVLDDQLVDFPEDGRFAFDAARGVVSVQSSSGRTPLLQAGELAVHDFRFVEETLAGDDLPLRLNRFAPSLAEALLAVEVEPCAKWRVWRDAMTALEPELTAALSNFGHEANLMPEHAPLASDDEFELRMDRLVPRSYPSIDRGWSNLGPWEKLTGSAPKRKLLQARFA